MRVRQYFRNGFDCPYHLETAVAISLKLQHDIDKVLHHLWPGDTALFGDMSNQHHCRITAFGRLNDEVGRIGDLAHGTGGAGNISHDERLNRVDDNQLIAPAGDCRGNVVGACRTHKRQLALGVGAEAVGA